jgi:hypothetical protein
MPRIGLQLLKGPGSEGLHAFPFPSGAPAAYACCASGTTSVAVASVNAATTANITSAVFVFIVICISYSKSIRIYSQ